MSRSMAVRRSIIPIRMSTTSWYYGYLQFDHRKSRDADQSGPPSLTTVSPSLTRVFRAFNTNCWARGDRANSDSRERIENKFPWHLFAEVFSPARVARSVRMEPAARFGGAPGTSLGFDILAVEAL